MPNVTFMEKILSLRTEWSSLPSGPRAFYGTETAYVQAVTSFSFQKQLFHSESTGLMEDEYYEGLLEYGIEHQLLYPYHLHSAIACFVLKDPYEYYFESLARFSVTHDSSIGLSPFFLVDALWYLRLNREELDKLLRNAYKSPLPTFLQSPATRFMKLAPARPESYEVEVGSIFYPLRISQPPEPPVPLFIAALASEDLCIPVKPNSISDADMLTKNGYGFLLPKPDIDRSFFIKNIGALIGTEANSEQDEEMLKILESSGEDGTLDPTVEASTIQLSLLRKWQLLDYSPNLTGSMIVSPPEESTRIELLAQASSAQALLLSSQNALDHSVPVFVIGPLNHLFKTPWVQAFFATKIKASPMMFIPKGLFIPRLPSCFDQYDTLLVIDDKREEQETISAVHIIQQKLTRHDVWVIGFGIHSRPYQWDYIPSTTFPTVFANAGRVRMLTTEGENQVVTEVVFGYSDDKDELLTYIGNTKLITETNASTLHQQQKVLVNEINAFHARLNSTQQFCIVDQQILTF